MRPYAPPSIGASTPSRSTPSMWSKTRPWRSTISKDDSSRLMKRLTFAYWWNRSRCCRLPSPFNASAPVSTMTLFWLRIGAAANIPRCGISARHLPRRAIFTNEKLYMVLKRSKIHPPMPCNGVGGALMFFSKKSSIIPLNAALTLWCQKCENWQAFICRKCRICTLWT